VHLAVPGGERDALLYAFSRLSDDLLNSFRVFDADGDGLISATELSAGLLALGVRLPQPQLEQLMLYANRGAQRAKEGIDYRRWCEVVREVLLARSLRLSDAMVIKLRDIFREHGVRLRAAFDAFDEDGDGNYLASLDTVCYSRSHAYDSALPHRRVGTMVGVLDYDEFRHGLEQLHLQLSDSEVDELLEHFDSDGSGTIEYAEFLRRIVRLIYMSTCTCQMCAAALLDAERLSLWVTICRSMHWRRTTASLLVKSAKTQRKTTVGPITLVGLWDGTMRQSI
jgi:Ca2+-binding EF-hand superfamily protein